MTPTLPRTGPASLLERLVRRLASAETYALCCTSATGSSTAETARADCEAVESEACAMYAELVLAAPGPEQIRVAREITDAISRLACTCRDHQTERRVRSMRGIRP